MKTVDKYQFNESQSTIHRGIQCFTAYHTILKKHFSLRRINHTDPNSNQAQNSLLKEATILKKINHQSVFKCHKMLKTKTHMYMVYDSIKGVSLAKLPPNTINTDIKISLVKKLSSVLLELNKARIAHIELQPENIVMQEEGKLKVIGFGNALQLPPQKDFISFQQKLEISDYSAPELSKNQACINSDVFSLGMVINKLFEAEFKSKNGHGQLLSASKERISAEYMSRLQDLTEKMLIKVPSVRVSISEISSFFNKAVGLAKDKPHHSSRNNLRSTNSREDDSQARPSPKVPSKIEIPKLERSSFNQKSKTLLRSTDTGVRSITSEDQPSTPTRTRNQIQASLVARYINKRRKLAMIICLMGQHCLNTRQVPIPIALNVAFVLLKKATVIITQLAKILKTGQGLDIRVDDKERQNFLKSNYCLKVGPVIDREMTEVKETFSLLCSRIKKVPQSALAVKQEIRSQALNNNTLRKCVSEFMNQLNFSNDTYYASIVTQQHLVCLYLVSLLSLYDTYEEAFDQLLCDSTGSFSEEPLVRELMDLEKLEMIQLIQMNTEVQYKENEQSKLLVKSTRTLVS